MYHCHSMGSACCAPPSRPSGGDNPWATRLVSAGTLPRLRGGTRIRAGALRRGDCLRRSQARALHTVPWATRGARTTTSATVQVADTFAVGAQKVAEIQSFKVSRSSARGRRMSSCYHPQFTVKVRLLERRSTRTRNPLQTFAAPVLRRRRRASTPCPRRASRFRPA